MTARRRPGATEPGRARHIPVLLSEVVASLRPIDGGTYIDGTFGAGGYTRAILEAAQLAAKFSQANNDSGAKVAVNYCEKKFVTKPKGFGPGQVRLSSFKTVLVEPAEAGERLL